MLPKTEYVYIIHELNIHNTVYRGKTFLCRVFNLNTSDFSIIKSIFRLIFPCYSCTFYNLLVGSIIDFLVSSLLSLLGFFGFHDNFFNHKGLDLLGID